MATDDDLVLIGLGANLRSSAGPPRRTLEAALERLALAGVPTIRRSRFWRTRPLPDDGQPWYVNAVASVATVLAPPDLLAVLLEIEAGLGRVRGAPNAPRVLDLDLLAHGRILRPGPEPPILPHPRMDARAFVLRPLAEVAPGWHHPDSGKPVAELIGALPPDQSAEPEM